MSVDRRFALLIWLLEIILLVNGTKISLSETALNRPRREIETPAPIDCRLSSWSEWSSCEPCQKEMYRSRTIEAFGQFGGKRCLHSLGDRRSCEPSRACDDEEYDCENDFKCETGRCIKKRLLCNVDNDCGDFSDEDNCEKDPRSPCHTDVELSELGRTAGYGMNILGMDPLDTPFDNEYFHGLCERVRDGNTGTYYRKPWNVATLNYDTKAEKRLRTENYEEHVLQITDTFRERQKNFGFDISLKLTSTEGPLSSLNAAASFDSNVPEFGEAEARAPESTIAKEEAPEDRILKEAPKDGTPGEAPEDRILKEAPKDGTPGEAPEGGTPKRKPDPKRNQQDAGLTFRFRYSKNESLHLIKYYASDKTKMFLQVKGEIQLGRFHMRNREFMLKSTFLDDLKALPTSYEKGEYFGFLETYGTHYSSSGNIGGKYELIYVLDKEEMQRKGLEIQDVRKCLGLDLDLSYQSAVNFEANIKGSDCSSVNWKRFDDNERKHIIDDVISLIEGGTREYATNLKEKLLRGPKVVDVTDFLNWSASLDNAPVLINQKLLPIGNLVPVRMENAHEKKQNLEQAINDYVDQFNSHKCQPCQNEGTTMLLDGECICACKTGFQGVACQISPVV
ncbi:complement component C9 isoform X1 [Monodelphis domestica]|uniref:complement component C9 isoform X1 n=1 Tax=Monodelphis domestica TaxID=13616 RepID=UPI0024E1D407|nr:complement component C9 isoform X1 [Monodelphis domestica]